MKSGGSGGSAPKQPQPNAAGVVPYGSTGAASTKFNPQYNSVLPVDAAGDPSQTTTAQLTDPMRMETGNRTPLLEQQEAAPIAVAGPSREDRGRAQLAMIMRMFGAGSMPGLSRGGGDRGSNGYGGSAVGGFGGGWGGGSGGSGSSASASSRGTTW